MVSDLLTHGFLHTTPIGMHDHLQKWIFHFMMMHERHNKHSGIWLFVPVYHDLRQKNISYEEVSQWTEKEMKEMRRYLLGVVTQTLQCGSNAQRPIFNHVIE
jgi:hypothetical protein